MASKQEECKEKMKRILHVLVQANRLSDANELETLKKLLDDKQQALLQ